MQRRLHLSVTDTRRSVATRPNESANMTSGYRRLVIATLRQPRWLVSLAVTVLMSVLFWWLGTWQWGRWERAHRPNEAMDAALAAPSAPLTSVVPEPGSSPPECGVPHASRLRQVQRRGPGAAAQPATAGRGTPILTPLVLDDGGTLLVERGFVPANPTDANAPPTDVDPPTGPVDGDRPAYEPPGVIGTARARPARCTT